jgi:putative flippase GtrA
MVPFQLFNRIGSTPPQAGSVKSHLNKDLRLVVPTAPDMRRARAQQPGPKGTSAECPPTRPYRISSRRSGLPRRRATTGCARQPNGCHGRCVLSSSALSLSIATLVTWRLNRALTFDASGRRQNREAVRYATVTAVAQGTSYLVFAVLTLTVLAALPQLAIIAGAAAGALLSYNGHRLFAFARTTPEPAPSSTTTSSHREIGIR